MRPKEITHLIHPTYPHIQWVLKKKKKKILETTHSTELKKGEEIPLKERGDSTSPSPENGKREGF